jgi:HK97 family phage major capsid protein
MPEIMEELRGKNLADDYDEKRIPDVLRGKTPTELQQFIEILDAHLRSIHQTDEGELRDKNDDEQAAFDLGLKIRDRAIEMIEENRRVQEIFRRRPKAVEQAFANIRYGVPGDVSGDVRRMTIPEARDKALRVLDDREATMHLSDDAKTQVAKLTRQNSNIARRILVTENEDYRNAWMKLVTEPHPILSPDEQQAVLRFNEYRAMADFTTSAGGFGIPVFIDPSIILTAQESGNPFLAISKTVDINTTIWRGVSSAGVTWSFQTEGAVTTDNSPTLAQPTVSVHMARGFIPFSIEVQSDYPNFAAEMQTLLAAGYDELLVQKFTVGSGTGEPRGILTAISATPGDRVKVVTGGSIGAPDPYAVWKALPQKFRRTASWLMSVGVNNAIRQIGTANVFHGYTVNLPANWADQLFNKAVYESPYMPDTTSFTTTAEGQALVGDFSSFVIARNGGMNVELVPQLFQQAVAGAGTGFPTGQRGWFAYARIGSDCVNTNAFRLLVANT